MPITSGFILLNWFAIILILLIIGLVAKQALLQLGYSYSLKTQIPRSQLRISYRSTGHNLIFEGTRREKPESLQLDGARPKGRLGCSGEAIGVDTIK